MVIRIMSNCISSSSSSSQTFLKWPKQLKLLQGPLFWGMIVTRNRKCYSKSNSFVAVAEKYVFSPFLNTDSDEADVMSLGRLFHTFAPATML